MFPYAMLTLIGVGFTVFLYRTPTGRMLRIVMRSTIRQIYLYLHPARRAMPTSLDEARQQQ